VTALPPPKKSWWAQLNAKPKGWDDPGAWARRMLMALGVGLLFWWTHSHNSAPPAPQPQASTTECGVDHVTSNGVHWSLNCD
jgi:hypothetical protein